MCFIEVCYRHRLVLMEPNDFRDCIKFVWHNMRSCLVKKKTSIGKHIAQHISEPLTQGSLNALHMVYKKGSTNYMPSNSILTQSFLRHKSPSNYNSPIYVKLETDDWQKMLDRIKV